jgi:hypothetical protein
MQHSIIIDRVRKRLSEAARQRELVFYDEFLEKPDYFGVVADPEKRNAVGTVLAEISQDEVLEGRPPLSAICVEKATGKPGPEFLRFIDPAKQLNDQQRDGMWQYMRDEVFKAWRKRKETIKPMIDEAP